MAQTRDAVLLSAVDVARAAAEEVAERPELVGEHVGVVVEGERLISHRFLATAQGYRGWQWSVTLARVPRARTATVCEVDLLPGDDAVLAPAWVPWSERLQPGDVGPTDVLPLVEDDDRLEQGYEATGDADADAMAIFELGLGRERVISPLGRSEAVQRWYTGSRGPLAPQAIAAGAPCSTCGFLLLMAGSLRTQFGVCGNEWSPDDGKVVSMDHGCGAHSQTDLPSGPSEWPDPSPLVGEPDLELVDLRAGERSVAAGGPAQPEVAADAGPDGESGTGAGADVVEPSGAPAEPLPDDAAPVAGPVEPLGQADDETPADVPAGEPEPAIVEDEAPADVAAEIVVPDAADADASVDAAAADEGAAEAVPGEE